jgi:indole-3-glycerol phosphate synthase
MNNFLQCIKESVRERLLKTENYSETRRNELDFCNLFSSSEAFKVIAEIKFSSPSSGRIHPLKNNPERIAKEYISHGASALSILTEPHYFDGHIEYIEKVRRLFPEIPILLKDFVLSEKQIRQGIHHGANAILLIAAFLEKNELNELYHCALDLGATPLIEIHNEKDLNSALELSPKLIGINNRNLKTLEVDLNISRKLISKVPNGVYTLCESGLKSREELRAMSSLGFDGFLMGSRLMRKEHPGEELQTLIREKLS